jgi:hypothetical protein
MLPNIGGSAVNSTVPKSAYLVDETLDDILSRHVDPFFIDRSEASFETSSGALLAVFSADFFGSCHVRKVTVGDLEEDLKVMASVAFDVFERKSTECASNGFLAEAARPVIIPEGFTLLYVPCKE